MTLASKTAEEFAVEALITQLVAEALNVTILPRTSRSDVDRLNRCLLHPVLDGVSDELGSVVAAQMLGCSVASDGRFQYP